MTCVYLPLGPLTSGSISESTAAGDLWDLLLVLYPVCNEGDLDSIPGLGRSPGEGKGYPLQYSGLENSMDCIVPGVTDSDTTEQLSGEGNGNPLQYLCPENPMDWSDFHFSIAIEA